MATAKEHKTLAQFFAGGHLDQFSKGEVIIRGDDISPEVFFIRKGFVKVYSINDDGDEYLHVIYRPGDIFPLIWVFRDSRRHVFYEALTPVTLAKMTKERFLKHIKANMSLESYALLMHLAEQFHIYADRLDNLQYKSAYERVVYRLLFMAGRFGRKTPKGIVIEAPITHKLIAQSVNLARESVSRELEKLMQRGLIDVVSGRIVIKNVDKLSKEFSEPTSLDYWGLQ